VAVNYISGSRTQQKHDFALKSSILLNIHVHFWQLDYKA